MTVAELIAQLQAMPQDAIAVDEDDLEVIGVHARQDSAIVVLWAEPK